MQNVYSRIVANEGGLELNASEKTRKSIASAMSYLYKYGRKDYEQHKTTDAETLTQMLIIYVESCMDLHQLQNEKLAKCAPQWATKAYTDGLNSQE